jgi:hypothetical protein
VTAGRHPRLVGIVFDDMRAQPRVAPPPPLLNKLDVLAPLTLQLEAQHDEFA